MSVETMQAIRTPQNKAEPIIDNTPETPFLSPLQIYINNNCQHCDWYHTKCRLEDSRGLTPMSLCISLHTHQIPAELGELLNPEAAKLKRLNTLKEIQEAELFLKERAEETRRAQEGRQDHDDS